MNKAQLKALQQTRGKVFREVDALRKKYGAATLPALRRYLTDLTERTKRQKAIAQLRRELNDLNKKGKTR